MEIYRAVCEFRSPQDDSSDNNILSFSKGDRFEVLDSNKKNIEWWGARALKDNSVGYVPSKYLKYEERKVGKLTSETNDNKILREKSIKRLNDIRQSLEYKPPGELYPDIPSPDYGSDSEDDFESDSLSQNGSLGRQSGSSSDEIFEDVCPALPEPDPDYLLEEEDDIDSVKVRPGQQNVTLIQVGLSRNHSGGMADYHDNRLTSELQQRLRNGSDSEQNGLILPKKLKNPCLESKERMDLHHELLLNKKTGKNVLKKSELEKKLKEREELRRKKEWEAYKNNKRTSLDLALEQRANALKEKEESSQSKPETTNNSEFSKVHAKITARACEN